MPPIRLKTFREFAQETLPTPKWLVDELLPGDGWSLLVAPTRTGKSLLAMQLAVALSTGGKFLGRPVPKKRVAYIQLDAPAGNWQQQIQLLATADQEPYTLTRADLPLYVLDPQHAGLQGALREALLRAGIELVIWDALEKLTFKHDLNKREGCQYILDRMSHVSPGPYLAIHHPRKEREGGDSLADRAAGHHYLISDASGQWFLKKTTPDAGELRVLTRSSDVTMNLVREPETYLWLPKPATPEPDAPGKYDFPPRR